MPDHYPLGARALDELARRALENFDLLQWVTGLSGPDLLDRLRRLVLGDQDSEGARW